MLILHLVVLCMAGCSRSPDQSTGSASKAPEEKPSTSAAASPAETLVVQSASPDQAVKTWWRYLDLVESKRSDNCRKYSAELPPAHLQYLPQIADADVLASLTPKPRECIPDVFTRDIDEVKAESETRAIVFGTIRNANPVPPGAEADEIEKKWRASGFKFKYLVEKTSGAWKISQVFRYDESARYLKKDVWGKEYELPSGPRYPAYVAQQ